MADIKDLIEERAGVPADLLTGETPEKIIASAKALLAYRRDVDKERAAHGSTLDQFAAWLHGGEDDRSAIAFGELETIEQIYKAFPELHDGSSDHKAPKGDGRPTREQFADYFSELFPGSGYGSGGGLIK